MADEVSKAAFATVVAAAAAAAAAKQSTVVPAASTVVPAASTVVAHVVPTVVAPVVPKKFRLKLTGTVLQRAIASGAVIDVIEVQ